MMNSISRFLREDTGAVTIEFVTLVPAFLLLLVFFTDVSIVYLTRAEMWSTARDISRRMSTQEITTPEEMGNYAESQLLLGQRTYSVAGDFGANSVVRIEVPMASAAIFGVWLTPVMGKKLSVTAKMTKEPFSFVIGDPLDPPPPPPV
jgi:hypothetical protein